MMENVDNAEYCQQVPNSHQYTLHGLKLEIEKARKMLTDKAGENEMSIFHDRLWQFLGHMLVGVNNSIAAKKEITGNEFMLEDMMSAINYGFTYHRDSMNDNIDVPDGNKLQWIISKYVPVEKQAEWIAAHNIK